MKINWRSWSLRSLYLFLAASFLSMLWAGFKLPWFGVGKFLPVPFAAFAFLVSYFQKRERLKREALREAIRTLSNDLTLSGDFTIDDFDLLYEVEELEQIVSLLMEMPEGQRKLQVAVDVVENESV